MRESTGDQRSISRDRIRVGRMLAEGGEGRVFELPLQPDLVFKEYRSAAPREHLEDLMDWIEAAEGTPAAGPVRAAAAWPHKLVGPAGGSAVAGVLVPRAPRRFALRHRDGTTRLATLSYLTADPSYRAVAYGLDLPPAFGPERLGLVYALSRLLEAFERLDPAVGHGDLSSKNVLWSLLRGPEVFVIDCDNCEGYLPDGTAVRAGGRRRAMTPNWDDPAVPPGANPDVYSDRYSLALIFLRVAGAANFPVQARQRQGGHIAIDFPVPPGQWGDSLVGPAAPLWELCSRGLTTADPPSRPHPSEWVAALEEVLLGMGASDVVRSVQTCQAGTDPCADVTTGPSAPAAAGNPAGLHGTAGRAAPGDVAIRPVAAARRALPPKRVVLHDRQRASGGLRLTPLVNPRPVPVSSGAPARSAGSAGPAGAPAASAASSHQESVARQIGSGLRSGATWWAGAHSSMLRGLGGGTPLAEALGRVVLCAAVDIGLLAVAFFVVAMAVAPLLGI